MKSLQLTLLAATAATLIIGPAFADDLTIAVRSETDSVDPHWGTSPQNNQITFQIFEPLAEYDNNRNLQPGLATSWTPLDDKTWEFKLRSGVKWHDGSPFTADDVLFTADRMLNHMPESQPSNVMFLKAGGKTIKKIDDMTVHITTDTVYPLVANDIATIGILSKKNATGAKPAEDYNNRQGGDRNRTLQVRLVEHRRQSGAGEKYQPLAIDSRMGQGDIQAYSIGSLSRRGSSQWRRRSDRVRADDRSAATFQGPQGDRVLGPVRFHGLYHRRRVSRSFALRVRQ